MTWLWWFSGYLKKLIVKITYGLSFEEKFEQINFSENQNISGEYENGEFVQCDWNGWFKRYQMPLFNVTYRM